MVEAALGKRFFRKHQRPLLWFINTWAGKWFFRIQRDVPQYKKIVGLCPNSFTWLEGKQDDGEHVFSTDFRTHNKFSKRLYWGLRPVWHLLHFLDMQVINPLVPAWNMGFDTLTVYPDADPESTSCDGYTYKYASDELANWSAIRDGGSPNYANDTDNSLYAAVNAGQYADGFDTLYRAEILFDTSSLGSGITVTAVTCSVYCISNSTAFGSNKLLYTPLTTALNTSIAASDHTNFTLGSGAYNTAFALTTGQMNDITLNTAGESNVNKTGITKIGIVFEDDYNNTDPVTWNAYDACGFSLRSADYTGISSDPKLVITYTGGAGGFDESKMFLMFD